jgi:hypothetical protein
MVNWKPMGCLADVCMVGMTTNQPKRGNSGITFLDKAPKSRGKRISIALLKPFYTFEVWSAILSIMQELIAKKY